VTQRPVFIDTTVLAHAFGGPSPQRAASRDIVRRAAEAELVLHASVEAVQEFLFHRILRSDRRAASEAARAVMGLCILHDFDSVILERAIDLVSSTWLGGRDAVHVATALEHGFESIVSSDRDFDDVPGLRRIEPSEV
jgi:predicted nucleic acid-binding protein